MAACGDCGPVPYAQHYASASIVTLINTALAMTARGLGLAILPATMLPADQFPTLIARPLVRPALARPVSLLQRHGRTLSPAAQAFVATARMVLAGRAAPASG